MAAAKAQTRKPDLKGLLTDPQFTSLSPSDKREALARVTGDTRFSSLSDEDLRTFSTRITGTASSSSPSPRASLSYDPADVGPAFRPPAGAKPVSPRTQTDAMIEQFTPDWNTPVNAAKGVGKTLLGIPKAAYALSPVKPVVEGTAEGYKTLTDRNLSWDEKQKQLQDISKREGLDIGKSVSGITAGKALTYDPIAQGYANAKEAAEQGKSIPEIIQRASEGVPVAGPMAQQSREAAEKGNNAEAIAGGATNVSLLASGLPKGSALRPLGAPVRVVTGGVMKVLPRAADTNAAMRSAFPGSSMTNETVAHMRGTAKEMGLSDADFSRNNPEAAGNVDKVVDAAKKNLQTQHNGLVDPVRQQPLKTPDLAPGMREKIASAWDNSDPGMAKRIRDNTTTVGDVDSIRGELNRLYEDTTYSSPEKTALQKWGKQVRNSFYDSLAEAHDIKPSEIRQMKSIHGDLLEDSGKLSKTPRNIRAQSDLAAGSTPMRQVGAKVGQGVDLATSPFRAGMKNVLGRPGLAERIETAFKGLGNDTASFKIASRRLGMSPEDIANIPPMPSFGGETPSVDPYSARPVDPATKSPAPAVPPETLESLVPPTPTASPSALRPGTGTAPEAATPPSMPPYGGPPSQASLTQPLPQTPTPAPLGGEMPSSGRPAVVSPPAPAIPFGSEGLLPQPPATPSAVPSQIQAAVNAGVNRTTPGATFATESPAQTTLGPNQVQVPPPSSPPAEPMKDFYRGEGAPGGGGQDPTFFSDKPDRAQSYAGPGGKVYKLSVPQSVAEEGYARARKAGSGTGGDAVFDYSLAKQAQPHTPAPTSTVPSAIQKAVATPEKMVRVRLRDGRVGQVPRSQMTHASVAEILGDVK